VLYELLGPKTMQTQEELDELPDGDA
jgi:hypothetical protein